MHHYEYFAPDVDASNLAYWQNITDVERGIYIHVYKESITHDQDMERKIERNAVYII